MSCLDNTDILRIVGGNSFQIAITVKARRVADGSEIEDFDLSASSPVLNLIHAGEKTRKYFVTQGNQAIISFDGSEGLGYYGMEMSGSYDSEAWRFCIEKVLQLVDTNAKANIPEWSFLVDDTYFIEGTISIYGGGGGGDTVQADWTETNPTSAAFILHKPDLSVYATKTEVASGLAGKQDTIEDLSTIRSGAAAGATAYQKPANGIPESDMSEGVQSALDKAEDAYQKPASGIPATDMSESVQASLEKANSAVQTETDPVFSNSPAAEISQNDINSWNAKQSAIVDLADIREGAAAGATAVQPDEMAQAIDGVEGDIADINAKIPTAASNLNQLADKAYVNSSIATNSATYRGSFNLITDLGMNVDATHAQIAGALATAIATADNNDYAFVQIPDSASTPTVIAKIERYKHNGTGWVYEYDLNNSGFTAAQWSAINSGITSGLVGKLSDLPNNSELATLLNGKQNVINDLSAIRSGATAGATAVQPADLTEALNDVEAEIAGLDESKQDVIEDLSTIRSGAAAGATAYQKPGTGIPESDMSEGVQSALGKADSAYQKPANGIPSTDMDAEVQAALEKANSAVQTETDPVFSNSPAAEITQADINNWNAKQPAIGDLADIREGAAAGATAVQPDEMAQAIDGVEGDIADINAKIPATASNLNQLADKAYVNSSIATNSATYRGSFNLITDLGMNVDATHAQIAGALATAIVTADNNDYAFVQIPDSASTPTVIAKIERYKHNGTGWVYEYDLNNSGFTAAQWAAINSGITSGLVGKLADLPNNSELATLLNGKQNVISDLSAIRSGASAGATAYQKPSSGIPASDMSSSVQQELSKANTAVQTETDPIFSASPAAGITAQNIQTWNGEPAARQAADTALQTAIQNEATARATADALLQQQYNALTQSDIIVGALPATGVPNVIYRVPGTTDFTDYMWYDNQFVPMATYGLPISAEFVVDNNLNKTQEEVNEEVSQLDQKVIYLVGMGTDATEAGATIGDYYYNTYYGNIKHLISGGSETIALKEGAVYMMGGELFSCTNGTFAKLNDVFGDWQFVTLQIGSIQISDGVEATNDKRFRTGAIYGKHYFILPTGYSFQQIIYYNISTKDFDSGFWVQKQYVHIDKNGCYARLVIARADYGVITDSDLTAIRVPTRIDDIVKTINANYSTLTEDIAVRDDIITEGWSRNNPVVTNTSRIRSAETTAWKTVSGFNITRVKIPELTKNARIILKNNTVAPTGGYLAFYFSENDRGSAAYLSGAGEQSVLVGEKANINDIIPIPATASYLFLCTDISASAGDTINNNNLQVYFEANAEESVAVAVERLIMPAITTGYLVDSVTGELIEASGYPYVDIDLTGKNYKTIRTYVTAFSNPRGYGFFFSDNSWVGVRPSASGDKTIEVPDGAMKFRFCWNPGSISANRQYFFAGVANTPDEAYKKAKKNDIFFQFLPDFNLSNIPAVAIPQITSDLSDIYGRYDVLLAAYPNYITKVDCSAADSVLGITRPAELSGMPIYIYKFSPVLTRIETFDVRPKAMIITGTHADEKLGIYTTWQIMKIICENWTTIHDAQILRTMADIYVMPLLNPWGFVNANNTVPGVPAPGRQNYNGVNLNRNFPTLNWTLTAVGTNYSGASAGSEYETKIAMYYIQQLKPDFFLDAHTGNMNVYGAMGAFEVPNVQNLRAVAYCSARTATTQLMIEDSSFGTNPDQSLFDVGGFSATGELAAWVFENICDLAFLSEQCVDSKWLNGVLTNTIQSSYTDTIYRENLQATYNLLLRCLYAAAISK